MRISDWSSDVCSSDLVTVEAGRLVAREALEGLAMLHQKGRLAARRQMDLAFQADEVVFRGGQGAQRQCASAQFLPVPASATSGTESCTAGWQAFSITSRTTAEVFSTSPSGTSSSSSSCTCSSMRARRLAFSSAGGTRIIARLMMSAAAPWIGALMAARSEKLRIAGFLSLLPGTWILRQKRVVTKRYSRPAFFIRPD